MSAKALMQKAYQKLDEKLDKGETTAIDGLVKLAKLEKDLDGEEKGAKEIKVRWEEKHESSSEG
ncbi:MAG: hypothetical protein HY236_04770 [Acidobacteria bacterium]|nr:hypothetical protein [Acidobacteriota bacterium]